MFNLKLQDGLLDSILPYLVSSLKLNQSNPKTLLPSRQVTSRTPSPTRKSTSKSLQNQMKKLVNNILLNSLKFIVFENVNQNLSYLLFFRYPLKKSIIKF